MSLFDTDKNIELLQLSMFVQPLPEDTLFVFGNSYIWFIESSEEVGPVFRRTPVSYVNDYYISKNEIQNIKKKINGDMNSILVDPNSSETISEQLGDIVKQYIINDQIVTYADKLFVSFNYNKDDVFKNIFGGYKIRHDFGQHGFDIPPENLGYLHIIFDVSECKVWNPSIVGCTTYNQKLHWFFPLAVKNN